MIPFNILLAQFLFLSIWVGSASGMVIYDFFLTYGFKGAFAGIVAGVISLSIIWIVVYKFNKNYISPIQIRSESIYATGNVLINIGNIIAILSIVPLFALQLLDEKSAFGVGMIFWIGCTISMISWLGGWYWIKSSLVKYG